MDELMQQYINEHPVMDDPRLTSLSEFNQGFKEWKDQQKDLDDE